MAGNVNFWNNGYVPFGGIAYKVSNLFLRIVSLLLRAFAHIGPSLRQLGIFLYFKPPAQSFSQMPMKNVHLE